MKSVLLSLLLLILYSCGRPEDGAIKLEEDSFPQSNAVPQTAEKGNGPKAFVVEIKKMKFEPEELQIHKGDTVVWINHDLVAHCITEEKSKAWTSGALPDDSSWKKVFTQDVDYFCAIHLVMKGKIRVN